MLKGDDRSVAELGFDEEGIPRLQLWEDGSGAGVKAIITPSGITMESGRAFGVVAQFTEGSIKMSGLPTSSDGLSLGTFYRDGNTIKIV
jgi:hypothetical protein